MKPIPKSLHTITAWVNVARHFMRTEGNTAQAATLRAECILQLDSSPDVYNLRESVMKQLLKGQK